MDELLVYENHLREGDGVGEQYVALADFYRFSISNGWTGLQPMCDGLRMESIPPKKVSKAGETNSKNTAHRMLLALVGAVRPDALKSLPELLKLKPELLAARKLIGPGFTLSADTVETHLKEAWDQLSE